MKNKIFCVLLVLLAVGSLFAGGQSDATIQGSVSTSDGQNVDLGGRELRYIAWWDPTENDEIVKAKIAYMEEKYNFKLVFINSGDWQAHHDDLVASVAAGDPVGEFVYIDQAFFAAMVSGNVIQPVEGHGVDFSAPYYHQIKREGFTLNGHEYGIKNNFIEPGAAVWFNKTLLEKEGIEDIYELQKSGKWTWDKMLEIAKKVTKDLDGDGTIDQWGFGQDALHVLALGLIASNGGNIVENGKLVINSPEALEALQFYQDLNVKYKVMAMQPEGVEWNWAYGEFGAGKIAFMPMWFWGKGQYGDAEDDLCWALMPAGPRGKMTSIAVPNNTVIVPTGIEPIEDILFVWDQIWKPHPDFIDPDVDPYNWIYDYFSDIESVEETQYMISEEGYYTIFTQDIFGLKEVWNDFPKAILIGEKSPRAALDEVLPVMKAKLAETLGQ